MSPRIDLHAERASPRAVISPGPAIASERLTREQKVLLVAALLSLVVHGLLTWFLWDEHIGWVEAGLLGVHEQVFRVSRDERHDTVDKEEPAVRGIATGQAAEGTAAPASLAALSQQLLSQSVVSEGLRNHNQEPLALRELNERRPEDADAAREALKPPVALPPSLTSEMSLGPSMEVPFNPGSSPVSSGGARPSGTGASEALALLSQGQPIAAPLPPGRTSPRDPLVRPAFPERRDTTPPQPFEPVAKPVPIDVAPVAPVNPQQLAELDHLDDDFEYIVTVYDPRGVTPEGRADPRAYYRVDIVPRRTLHKLKTMPKDVVFAVDTSASVSQDWVKSIIRGVKDALYTLNPGDRFNIVFFKDNPEFFSPEGPQPVNQQSIAAAEAFLDGARSGGYTDVNRALSRLLVRDVAMERVYDLVLISDGQPTRGVVGTRELLNLITRDNDLAASIYCVSVGKEQNRELLQYLAYRNKGYCMFTSQDHAAANAIRDLGSRLRYPIMKSLRLSAAGLDSEAIYPKNLPNIHQGETLSIYGRAAELGPFTMRLLGHNGDKAMDFTFTRNLREARGGEKDIARDWGFLKLHYLYSEMLRLSDDSQTRAAIEELRRQYGLKTVY